jgi:hypothetical protein
MTREERALALRCEALDPENNLLPGYVFQYDVVNEDREVLRLAKIIIFSNRENVFQSGVRLKVVGTSFL